MKENNSSTGEILRWRLWLAVLTGITLTLLIIAIIDYPSQFQAILNQGYMNIDGWFGIWFLSLIASISGAMLFTFSPKLRMYATESSPNPIFWFTSLSFVNLVALDLRLATLFSTSLHWINLIAGVILGMYYLYTRQRSQKPEELFP